MFWTDVNHSLEYIASSLGAIKAGATIVSAEFENWEDVKGVLDASKADVLIMSPYTQVEKNRNKIDLLSSSIPEMKNSKKMLFLCLII